MLLCRGWHARGVCQPRGGASAMAVKDLYRILGVARDASQAAIRAAYRRLAKKYHPDKAGPEATRRFQEITRAYQVLSDPERRRAYNHELLAAEARHVPAPRPSVLQWPVVELTLGVSPLEAAGGCRVPVELLARRRCPSCEGLGAGWGRWCAVCGGRGWVRAKERVWVELPGGLAHGQEVMVRVDQGEFAGVVLRIKVLIEPHWW